jgi:hypothetical protein
MNLTLKKAGSAKTERPVLQSVCRCTTVARKDVYNAETTLKY